MWFLSPLWLLGLIPWGGVTLLLLWGRLRQTHVPYLELWRGAMAEAPKRPGVRIPPSATLLAIFAMLLAVLSAARPGVWGMRAGGSPLEVVIDGGLTMSASRRQTFRFQAAAADLAEVLTKSSNRISVHLLVVPGETDELTDAGNLTASVNAIAPSGLRTAGMLDRAVAKALRSGDGPVFVVSDEPIELADPRVVRIAPPGQIDDVGIAQMAARQTPAPQIMVRLLNQSSQSATTLDVMTAGQRLRHNISLPARGLSRDYFFDPAELGETIEAELNISDDLSMDDRAWLVRAARWPVIESRVPLDPALERMISVYAKHRVPTDGSVAIRIVDQADALPAGQQGVVLPQNFADASGSDGSLVVTDMLLTRGMSWGAMPLLPASSEPPAGWDEVVRAHGKTILAVQELPARKVWIGFAIDQWSSQTQYVVFWTNVFDWIGQSGREFSSSPLEERTAEWKPLSGAAAESGIYQRDDRVQRAFNVWAAAFPKKAISTPDWRRRLIIAAEQRSGNELAGALAFTALVFLLGALLFWRKGPAISKPVRLTPVEAKG